MMPDIVPTIMIPVSAVIAIVFGLWLWKRVSAISLVPGVPCCSALQGHASFLAFPCVLCDC